MKAEAKNRTNHTHQISVLFFASELDLRLVRSINGQLMPVLDFIEAQTTKIQVYVMPPTKILARGHHDTPT
jgi:hypothetical protein